MPLSPSYSNGRNFNDSDKDRYSRRNDRDNQRYREQRSSHGEDRKPRSRGDSRPDDRRAEYSTRRDKDRQDDRHEGRRYDHERSDRRSVERRGERERDHGGSSRRSASPRHNGSRPRSKSPSPSSKAKPNFNQSGLLAAATNTVKAADGSNTVLKYNEPPEARKPVLGWRLYVFKGSEQVELLHIHRQSAYLIGRDRAITDIAIEHPSCSKQHAVIQHRQVQHRDEFGEVKTAVKPFIIDLESTNGTHVNDETVPVSRFFELKSGDVIKFGLSTREYVLLHDEAA